MKINLEFVDDDEKEEITQALRATGQFKETGNKDVDEALILKSLTDRAKIAMRHQILRGLHSKMDRHPTREERVIKGTPFQQVRIRLEEIMEHLPKGTISEPAPVEDLTPIEEVEHGEGR